MQGRLSPQTERGYQAFPWESWEAEFYAAPEYDFQHIEWVLDTWNFEHNPLFQKQSEIADLSVRTGVRVISVCADYLMDRPLSLGDTDNWNNFSKLLDSMEILGANWLVIPYVDQSSLQHSNATDVFLRSSERIESLLEARKIIISLETDLAPVEFKSLLDKLDPDVFGVNYDIGNSASLGFQAESEFEAYENRINLVHIKDRLLGSGSVELGSGAANLPWVLDRLKTIDFQGPATMQAFRDMQGSEVLKSQLRWLNDQVKADS